MKEYLLINIAFLVVILHLDLSLKTKLFVNRKFWYFHIIVFLLAIIIDNYLSGRPIVIYNSEIITNVRLGYVPIENFLFGFDLLTLNLILFEFTNKKHET